MNTLLLAYLFAATPADYFGGLDPQARGITGVVHGSTVTLVAPRPVPTTDKQEMYSLTTRYSWSK